MGEPPDDPDAADDDGDPTVSRMGGAPKLLGGDRMRKDIAAALFGPDLPEAETDGTANTIVATDTRDDRYDDLKESIIEDRLGRFRVLERLGRGGMGVVYSAYDPQLDRKVAIKLLRPDVHKGLGAEAATARLLREAQAMAKLNDPHVIVVHEVGTLADRVFVAMEFVEGGTLARWMAERRTWREVLDTFLRAGSGLAAAHKAGLVHRDFKPDNVLMGNDGRVRVLDFGLARSVLDEEASSNSTRPSDEQPELDSLNTPLTRTGAVMGTPAYMSPEQHLGRPADVRSDQFSFCVALFEGLFGQRPFAGGTLGVLAGNVIAGVIREPPANIHVPRWITAALRRGLSRKPEDRFETMDALLAELRSDPRRKWKFTAVGVVAIGIVAFVGIGAYQKVLTGECDALVDSMVETWNDSRRGRVAAGIESSGVPWGPRAAESTTKVLDAYAEDWQRRVQNVCLSSQVGSPDAAATWDTKRLCFEDRRAGLDQLVLHLSDSGSEMATTALQAAVSLSDLSVCEDPRQLGVWAVLADPKAQERLAHARRRLIRASTSGNLGEWQKAVEAATAVVEDARELGVPALEAAALVVRGLYRERAEQNVAKAEEDLRLAVERAKEAGDPGIHAQALIQLVYTVSRDPARYDEARLIGERAHEVIQSLGSEPLLEAHLDAMLGLAARGARQWDVSEEYTNKALETRRTLLGDSHPDTIRTVASLGQVLCWREPREEGEARLREAVEGYETVLGGDHPELGTVLSSLGNCLARRERYEDALAVQARALELYQRDLDPDDPRIMTLEYNIAFIYQRTGNHKESLRRAREGIVRAERLLADQPSRFADWKDVLATGLEETGDLRGALDAHKETLALHRRINAPFFRAAGVEIKIARVTEKLDRGRGLILAEELASRLAQAGDAEDVQGARRDFNRFVEASGFSDEDKRSLRQQLPVP